MSLFIFTSILFINNALSTLFSFLSNYLTTAPYSCGSRRDHPAHKALGADSGPSVAQACHMGCRLEAQEDPAEAGAPAGIEFAGILSRGALDRDRK